VLVEPLPIIGMVADTVFCADEILSVPVQVVNANVVEWTFDGAALENGSNAQNLIVVTSGVYFITASNSVSGCTKVDSVEVGVISVPDFNPEDQLICPNEQIELVVPNEWQVVSWWDGSNMESIIVDAPGNYVATIEALGCESDVSFEVMLWEVPHIDLGPDLDWCLQDGPLVIGAEEQVTWSDGTLSAEIAIDSSTLLVGTWSNGECIVSDTVNILITVPPVVSISGTSSLCYGEVGELQSSHIGWWNTEVLADQIPIDAPGLYSITYSEGPCQIVALFSTEALPDPLIDLGVDRLVCVGESVELMNMVDQSGNEVMWSTGEEETSVRVDEAGMYYCEVNNICGSAMDSVRVVVEECESSMYIPNSFTPNNDGINDIWLVDGVNILINEIFITNRWGHRIFHSHEQTKPWLGDVEGGPFYAPADAYIFTVRYTDKSGNDLEERGVVLLIR
jgi:gliding motility-associated-like protein